MKVGFIGVGHIRSGMAANLVSKHRQPPLDFERSVHVQSAGSFAGFGPRCDGRPTPTARTLPQKRRPATIATNIDWSTDAVSPLFLVLTHRNLYPLLVAA